MAAQLRAHRKTALASLCALSAWLLAPVARADVDPDDGRPGGPRRHGPPAAAPMMSKEELDALIGARLVELGVLGVDGGVATAPAPPAASAAPQVVPTAYVEASYAYNFNQPSNGITAFRGFDNRHNTFMLQNVAAGATFQAGGFDARVIFQVGSTASTVYLVEPSVAGASSANASSGDLWKYVQEAWVAYRVPIGTGFRIQAGICLSPIGPEGIAVKDNWNWSRSNLFFALPAYHLGGKVSYDFTERFSATLGLYNGWNNVADNNDARSVAAQLNYKVADKLNLQVLYFGGAERPRGAPEAPSWRHLFDAYLQWDVVKVFSVLVQFDGGFEPNTFGTSAWSAGALYFRVRPVEWLAFAVRGDFFYELVAQDGASSAAAIFWPSPWVSSGTATIELRPHDGISFRLEYRHDQSGGPTYFSGDVTGDGSALDPYVLNAVSQDTLLLGLTGWF